MLLITEQEMVFVLVITAFPSPSSVDCRGVWKLMHRLWLDVCQDTALLSRTELYEALSVAWVHLSPIQHCRDTPMCLSALLSMHVHSCLRDVHVTHADTHRMALWKGPEVNRVSLTAPVNPILAPTCLVLWFMGLERLQQGSLCLQNPVCCSRGLRLE